MSNMRSYCYNCMRSLCLCEHIQTIDNQLDVVILQHSKEQKNNKNTAILLNLSLKKSQFIRGKNFDEFLANLLHEKNYLLVFPKLDQHNSSDIIPTAKDSKIDGIILIDGTWKKARKIYYESKILQNLPKIYIDNKSNQYIIRKSPAPNALSTYEAGVFALEILGEQKTQVLMERFKNFMEMSLSSVSEYKREKL